MAKKQSGSNTPSNNLASNGIYVLMDDINTDSCRDVIKWIMNQNLAENRLPQLTLIINSPGGDVHAAFALIDTMKASTIPIKTVGLGLIASCGFLLFIAGAKGKRFSLPNSRIMVHQPSAGFQGQATDIEIHANEVLSLKKRLNEIYSKHTGKSVDEIKSALERDNFMTADVAKSFGLVDEVVEKRS